MAMPSVNQYSFSQVPQATIPRSSFDRSHGHKTTFDSGYLVPVFIDEALPGDTFNLSMAGFGRMATPLHPIMDNLHLETFFFAVPYRLLWDNWQRFNGEQDNPGDSTDYLIPTVTTPAGGWDPSTIGDYFGIPTSTAMEPICAFPFRAYNLIYNEWFRDQNLQDSITVQKDDGPDNPVISGYQLRRRGKRHDYFTSCLPWPQKGEEVTIPLGQSARVAVDNVGTQPIGVWSTDNQEYIELENVGASNPINLSGSELSSQGLSMYADLTSATSATINQLREAFQIQKLYERDARGGTRYTEIIRSHFGVTSPDARLQRPEYLGGGKTAININEVQQTGENNPGGEGTNLGDLGATGRMGFNSHGFTKSFTEHSVILGLVCIRADLNYQQGLNRMWSRQSRFDYYWPSLAHLGEQAVLSKEIYTDGTAADDDVFGYQERYAEYRYKPSIVTGEFRSNFPQPLDSWHLAQNFGNRPVLDADFIEENPPVDRVIAVQDGPQFIFDSWFKLTCARPMPTYSIPGMIDHF